MLKRIVRGAQGFTLIELLAVMAIVAVLAGIVAVAVSGTGSTSRDTQVVEDSNSAGSSIADYFSDQPVTEVITTQDSLVLNATSTESASNQFPETLITTTYGTAFEATAKDGVNQSITATVEQIILRDTSGEVAINEDSDIPTDVRDTITVSEDGSEWVVNATGTDVTLKTGNLTTTATISGTGYTFTLTTATETLAVTVTSGGAAVGSLTPFDEDDLMTNFAALDFDTLSTGGYVTTVPESFKTTSTDDLYNNYLWLLEADEVSGSTGSVSSRNVVVYVLTKVEDIDTDNLVELTFQRLV